MSLPYSRVGARFIAPAGTWKNPGSINRTPTAQALALNRVCACRYHVHVIIMFGGDAMKSQRLTLFISPEDKRQLKSMAEDRGISTSEFVRQAVHAYGTTNIEAPR